MEKSFLFINIHHFNIFSFTLWLLGLVVKTFFFLSLFLYIKITTDTHARDENKQIFNKNEQSKCSNDGNKTPIFVTAMLNRKKTIHENENNTMLLQKLLIASV